MSKKLLLKTTLKQSRGSLTPWQQNIEACNLNPPASEYRRGVLWLGFSPQEGSLWWSRILIHLFTFFGHIQSRIRSVSIGIVHSTYTTSAIQHIMTSMDKTFYNVKQIQAVLSSVKSASVITYHFYPSHKTVNLNFVWYCIIMLRVKWHAVLLLKAYYKYMCYQWSIVIFRC